MRHVNLRNVDLNLLVAFRALMEERSVSGAARRIFLSQPAMSRVFDRLQATFGDPLLVRTGSGYEPTYRASMIYAELQELLPRIEALFQDSPFDPAAASGVFRIESTDWGATMIIPALIRILARQAPAMEIDVIPRTGGFELLEGNQVDLVFAPQSQVDSWSNGGGGKALRSMPLVRESNVCLMRKGHPLARTRLTLRQYLNARHVWLVPMLEERRTRGPSLVVRKSPMAEVLRRLGHQADVRVQVPYFASAGPIVAHTDLIATVPLHLARRWKTPKTCIVPLPKEIPDIIYAQVWHERHESSPAHRWIREKIQSVAAQIA